MGALWKFTGNWLETYWKPTGNLLKTYWKLIGNLLETYWKPTGNLLKTNWKLIRNLLETYWNFKETYWKLTGNLLKTYCKLTENLLKTYWKFIGNLLEYMFTWILRGTMNRVIIWSYNASTILILTEDPQSPCFNGFTPPHNYFVITSRYHNSLPFQGYIIPHKNHVILQT